MLLPGKCSLLGLILLPGKIQRADVGKGASPESRGDLFTRNVFNNNSKSLRVGGR